MMDIVQGTYAIAILVGIAVVVLIAMLAVFWYHNHVQHERIAEKIAALPPSPEGTERIIGVVEEQQEMTRQHVSASVGSIAHETEMNKGLLMQIRSLYDGLVALLIKAVTPGDPPVAPKPQKKDDTQ